MFGWKALTMHPGSTSVTGDYFWSKSEEKLKNEKKKRKQTKPQTKPILPTDYRQQHVVQEQGDEDDEQDESPGLAALPEPAEGAELAPSHVPVPAPPAAAAERQRPLGVTGTRRGPRAAAPRGCRWLCGRWSPRPRSAPRPPPRSPPLRTRLPTARPGSSRLPGRSPASRTLPAGRAGAGRRRRGRRKRRRRRRRHLCSPCERWKRRRGGNPLLSPPRVAMLSARSGSLPAPPCPQLWAAPTPLCAQPDVPKQVHRGKGKKSLLMCFNTRAA